MPPSKLTFCINTCRNERHHVELLFRSLYKNLARRDHDILVYVENDNQGTTEWLVTQKQHFPNLKIIKNPLPVPLGYARNINIMFEMAQTDVVSYLQSDMVISPLYDETILKFLTPDTILSSTRIEPPLHPPSPEKITRDFGLDPQKFDLNSFSAYAEASSKDVLTDYWFAPFTLYKKVWNDIGGHDTLFRRSREDSDLLYRFSMTGIKLKQTWNALVYHFTCTSSRGIEWWTGKNQERAKLQQIADSVEMGKFLRKWPSFKHTTTFDPDCEYKYQISANLYGAAPMDYDIIQNYFRFHRIYIDNPETRELSKREFDHFQSPANKLFGISPDEWDLYKKYYHAWKSEDIFVNEPIVNDDVILDKHLNGSTLGQHLKNNIYSNLNELVHANREDSGSFMIEEIDAQLTINRAINRIRENIVVNNPPLEDVKFVIL